MTAVGVRELKNSLSRYLRRVKAGDRLVVTERGEPVAIISPPTVAAGDQLENLLRQGVVRWSGGKPRGSRNPPRTKGPTVARAVIEDRR
jgi:prevent-host-death family protein